MRTDGGYGDYGARAQLYDEGRPPFPNWLFQRLYRKLANKDRSATRILDVGCGTGVGTRLLVKHSIGALPITAIDIDPLMLDHAKQVYSDEREGRITYRCVSLADTDYPDESFDVIVTFGGLPWFYDMPGALTNIQRMLKANGIFAAFDEESLARSSALSQLRMKFTSNPPRHQSCWYAKFYSILKSLGLKEVHVDYREELVSLTKRQAFCYIASGSWMNFVANTDLKQLCDEINAYVESVADANGIIHWPLRFYSAMGRKPE